MNRVLLKSQKIKNYIANLDQELRLVLLSIITGIVGGFGAILFRYTVYLVHNTTQNIKTESEVMSNAIILITPALGGLIAGLLVTKFASEARGHGVPQIIHSVNLKEGFIRPRVPLVKIIASSFTIGSGGSAGREGPIAQIGGGCGSILATYFGLRSEERKTLVIAGVSAGIAASFNAPLGGVLFGVEIIRRDKKSVNILPLIVSSVVGTSIGEYFLGLNPAFIFPVHPGFQNFFNIPKFIFLGLIMGLLSILWIKGFYFLEEKFEKLRISKTILPAIGGLMVGFIELWYPQVSGIDYSPIDNAFAMKLSLTLMLSLVVLKFLATTLTLGTGGSGGVFAPTLFMGVMMGTSIGVIFHSLGFNSLPIPIYGILGMAGFFAATSRAPLTAVVMTAEMINDYQLFIPLMFSVSIAWIINKVGISDDIYVVKMKKQGINFDISEDLLDNMTISDIMVQDIVSVSPKDRLEHVLELMIETGHTGYPVVKDGDIFGIITEHDVDHALESKEMKEWIVSEVCTQDVFTVVDSCPVSQALLIMDKNQINRFPVVDHNDRKKLVGWITRSDLFRAYRIAKQNSRKHYEEEILFQKVHSGDLHL